MAETGKTLSLKMAKPSKKDFDCVNDFIRGLEHICEYQMLPGDDDSEEDGPSPTDEEFFNWIQRSWDSDVGCSIFRVVMAGQVAIENACDPSLDYLDFKPELKQAAEQRDKLLAAAKAVHQAGIDGLFVASSGDFIESRGARAVFSNLADAIREVEGTTP